MKTIIRNCDGCGKEDSIDCYSGLCPSCLKNAEREELIDRLNEFDSDNLLIYFNRFLNGSLDNQMNEVLNEWTNEEFKEFIEFTEIEDKINNFGK